VNRSRTDAASPRGTHQHRRFQWLACAGLAAIGVHGRASAESHASPYVNASYEYNSNVFALPDSAPTPVGNSGPTFSDRISAGRAGLDAAYDWSRQELYAKVEGRRFDYQQFRALNHNEYLLNGGWKWRIASILDGVLDYKRERSMVSFADFTATELFVQQQNIGTATLNLQINPEWRLETRGRTNDLESPRPGVPNLSLHEQSFRGGVRYAGVANLSAGLDGEYLEGHFNGDQFVVTPRYHQSTGQLVAKYELSGLSNLDSAVGYTRRVEQAGATISAVTGSLAYQRELTGKTAITLRLGRDLSSYVTYGSTQLETSAGLEATWNASSKIAVNAGYRWSRSTFPGTGASSVIGERADHYQLATLSGKYQVLHWLSLRPFGQYERRSSNTTAFEFNRTLYGLEAEARLQ
jgi:hypothetical protein